MASVGPHSDLESGEVDPEVEAKTLRMNFSPELV